jgi:NTP pyrophosphatase (non-canonical NTP hydrolase)
MNNTIENDENAFEDDGKWLDDLQQQVSRWQLANFPDCEEWELALGVCEEAGELAQCVLKIHRQMRKSEFDEDRLKDAVGDIVIFLMGVCDSRGWLLSETIKDTAKKVMARDWRSQK